MSNLHKNQRGSVIILVTLAMIVFIGFAALALEVGFINLQKTRLQSTADAAALACVIKSTTCGSGGLNQFPNVNFYSFTVNTTYPVLCPPLNTQTTCAQAVASTTWNAFFGGFFGVPRTFSLAATAVASNNGNVPSCLITMGNFSANGTNQATLNNCAASIGGSLSTTNKSGITVNNLGNINVFNGGSASGCGQCTPTPVSVPGPIPNLPNSTFPTNNIGGAPLVALDYTQCTNSSCVPAIYSGTQPVMLTADTTLATGNYVFNSGFDNGGHKLTSGVGGVSLYIPGNKVFNMSSGTINLTAPSSVGCTAGSMSVITHPYVPPSPMSMNLNGSNVNLTLAGVVNLSADDITVRGTSANVKITGSLVAHSIDLRGNMMPTLSSDPCFNLYESTGKPILVN